MTARFSRTPGALDFNVLLEKHCVVEFQQTKQLTVEFLYGGSNNQPPPLQGVLIKHIELMIGKTNRSFEAEYVLLSCFIAK